MGGGALTVSMVVVAAGGYSFLGVTDRGEGGGGGQWRQRFQVATSSFKSSKIHTKIHHNAHMPWRFHGAGKWIAVDQRPVALFVE